MLETQIGHCRRGCGRLCLSMTRWLLPNMDGHCNIVQLRGPTCLPCSVGQIRLPRKRRNSPWENSRPWLASSADTTPSSCSRGHDVAVSTLHVLCGICAVLCTCMDPTRDASYPWYGANPSTCGRCRLDRN